MTRLPARLAAAVTRHAPLVAGAAAAVMLASALLAVPALLTLNSSPTDFVLWPALVAFIACGWLLAVRVPTNAVGWLLLLTSFGLSLLSWSALSAWLVAHDVGLGRWLAGIANALFVFIVGGLGMLLPLLFPDGRLPSRRRWWRVVLWCDLGFMFFAAFNIFDTANLDLPGLHQKVQNPFAVDWLTSVIAVCVPMLFIGYVGSFSSVIVRWRRADAGERAQMKWVILALGIAPVPFLLHDWIYSLSNIALTGVLPLVPIAVAVSVLRYRLYDIDRIVSRAVSYLLVTGLLVGVYVGCVALAETVLPVGSSSLTVAASTLAVAALFQPVRRRVQRGVDHRFNRQRYDAARTVDAFAGRLRDEVDPDIVRHDLLDVAVRAIQPSTISLWVAS